MTSPYLMYNIASPNISWQTDINEQYLHSEYRPSTGNKLALYSDLWLFTLRTFLKCSVDENSQRVRQWGHRRPEKTKAHTQSLDSWWQNRFLMTGWQQRDKWQEESNLTVWKVKCRCKSLNMCVFRNFFQINKHVKGKEQRIDSENIHSG